MRKLLIAAAPLAFAPSPVANAGGCAPGYVISPLSERKPHV
jgi:hypothetical protein